MQHYLQSPVLLLILVLFFLPGGTALGWLIRGRRAKSELSRLRGMHADSQFQLEETLTAFEIKKRELETVKLQQHHEPQPQANNEQPRNPFSEREVDKALPAGEPEDASEHTPEQSAHHPLDERREGLRRAGERQAAAAADRLTQNHNNENHNNTDNTDSLSESTSGVDIASEDSFFNEAFPDRGNNTREYFASERTSITDKNRLEEQEQLIVKLIEKSRKQAVEISRLQDEKDSADDPAEEITTVASDHVLRLMTRINEKDSEISQLRLELEANSELAAETTMIMRQNDDEASLQLAKDHPQAIMDQAANQARIASLTTLVKQQQSEQLNQKKTIVRLHKKLQQSALVTQQLNTKINDTLENSCSALSDKSNGYSDGGREATRGADDLAIAVEALDAQVQQSEQLKSDYETLNNKWATSSARTQELESSLQQKASLEQDLELARGQINSLRLVEQTAQELKSQLTELQNQNTHLKQESQQTSELREKIVNLERNNEELLTNSRRDQSLQQKLDETRIRHNDLIETLESRQLEQQQSEQKIDELQHSLSQAATDKELISTLERDLQTAKKNRHSDTQKINTLYNDVQALTEHTATLKSEKNEWQVHTANQENRIVSLTKEDLERENQLGQLRAELDTRDEKLVALGNRVTEHENRDKQLNGAIEAQKAENKAHSDEQKEQIDFLTEELHTSASEIELLTKDLQKLAESPAEIESLHAEKSVLLEKLDSSIDANQVLQNIQKATDTKVKELIEENHQLTQIVEEKSNALDNAQSQANSAINLQSQLKSTESAKKQLSKQVESLQKANSTLPGLQAAYSESEKQLNTANTRVSSLETELAKQVRLEETLQQQERDITSLRLEQAQALDHEKKLKGKLEKARELLAETNAALSERNTESRRLSTRLEEQQQLKDKLSEQNNLIDDLQSRVSAFDSLKLELTASREAHDQLQRNTPNTEALRNRLTEVERKNNHLLRETGTIPHLQKQLADLRLKHSELSAIHGNMKVQLESLQKENSNHKTRARKLLEQTRDTTSTTEHAHSVRKEASTHPSDKKRAAKNTTGKSTQPAGSKKAAGKKQSIGQSAAGNSSKQTATKKNQQQKPQSSVPDDLKKIHGIGPVLEKLLHKNGITRFEQLAALDTNGIAALSGKLGSFSNRITRDDWVGSAAKLVKTRARNVA